ncbi:type I methionyl aminopeptidase [Desulforamulus ruminis]|uniref:Methionine aminopeptidase n=1 Tax=Desulforamulus ruminis (strain ATCC 23193 / DSM 2154 / NCIMB 8452 / DL) TaxID=696281 RepID=F6DLN8_DESRL|nr:type I methionyl aminopeptidase [Desulforamulus ruminis]AEG61680.1 methionine aminopeptidase, type I [Desulforamulus ruminis DSM 2154]
MIILKSAREIEIMREAGRIVAECHRILAERIKPGITTLELDQTVEKHIRQRGATPSFKGHQGFPAAICVALNDVICHGFPGPEPLQKGDVVTIDVGAFYKGYHGDSAWTYAVGEVSEEIRQLMEVGRKSLYLGIELAQPGNRIGDIGAAIQTYAEKYRYGVVREFCGHGVGQNLWESPQIPHFGRANTGPLIKAGMTLAIEPMITLGKWKAVLDKDGWTARTVDGSICVQYEHTLAVTAEGPVILTEI